MTRHTAVLSAALLLWVGCTDNRTTPVVGLLADNTNLSLNSDNTTLKVGQTLQLSIIHAHNGLTYTGNAVWQSSAPAVASVDATGLVTAVAPGTANITATNPSGEQDDGSAIVTVESPALTLTVTGLTWGNCVPSGNGTQCYITSGFISGASPGEPISVWDVTQPLIYRFGGLTGGSGIFLGPGSLVGRIGDLSLVVPGGIPGGLGDVVWFCPNDWAVLWGLTGLTLNATDSGQYAGFALALLSTGFGGSQGCAGPFTIN